MLPPQPETEMWTRILDDLKVLKDDLTTLKTDIGDLKTGSAVHDEKLSSIAERVGVQNGRVSKAEGRLHLIEVSGAVQEGSVARAMDLMPRVSELEHAHAEETGEKKANTNWIDRLLPILKYAAVALLPLIGEHFSKFIK